MMHRKREKRKSGCGCLGGILCITIVAFLCTYFILNEGHVKQVKDLVVDKMVPFQEVLINEDDLESHFYFQQLTEEEQRNYKEIAQGIKDRADEIYIHCTDLEKVNEIYLSVLSDYPEFFWCSGGGTSVSYEETSIMSGYTVLSPQYSCTEEEIEERQLTIDQAVAELISGIPQDADEYERIKYVYEYIVQRTEYNKDAPDNQTIYSVLGNWSSVCAGYAKTNQYVLERLGIFCTYIVGDTYTKEQGVQSHAWNLVRCDEKYYYVDVTWADPVFQNENDIPDIDFIAYDYLCCTLEQIEATHSADAKWEYPVCDSDDLNYFKMNHLYYEDFNQVQALDVLKQSIDEKQAFVEFKYANKEVFDLAREKLEQRLLNEATQYLCKKYNLTGIEYSWRVEELTFHVMIFWQYESN